MILNANMSAMQVPVSPLDDIITNHFLGCTATLWEEDLQSFFDIKEIDPAKAHCFAVSRNNKVALFQRTKQTDSRFSRLSLNQWKELFTDPTIAKEVFPDLLGARGPAITNTRTLTNKFTGIMKLTAEPVDSFAHHEDILPQEGDEAGLNGTACDMFEFLKEGEVVGLGKSGEYFENRFINIGIYVYPEHRGNGYATEMVEHLSEAILKRENVAVYRYVPNNLASSVVSRKIDFDHYGETLAITLASSCE